MTAMGETVNTILIQASADAVDYRADIIYKPPRNSRRAVRFTSGEQYAQCK